MPNQNFDLPPFLNNTQVNRSDLRKLGRAITQLSNDVANRYTLTGSEILEGKFNIEIFPAIVGGPAYPSADDTTPTAQYAMTRAITTTGLTPDQTWGAAPDLMPGFNAPFIATNYAELGPEVIDPNNPQGFLPGPPISNSVQEGQQVLVMAVWSRGNVATQGTQTTVVSAQEKFYVFYWAIGNEVKTLKITDVYGSFIGGVGAGSYMAAIGTGQVNALDPTNNFQPPDADMTFPVTPNAVWRNVFEAGSGSVGTNVVVVGAIVQGVRVGSSNDTPALPVYYGGSAPSGTHFDVILVYNSGDDGTAGSPAAYQYDVWLIDNSVQLATNLLPETPRPNGKMQKAVNGAAYLDTTGVVILALAYEFPITAQCSSATMNSSPAGPASMAI